MTISYHAATATKIVKVLINIVVLVLYRNGDEGYFMGATYNKNHDAEALASGIYIGFLIYNFVALISTVIHAKSVSQSITDTLMNLVGAILWVTAGGVIIQFWLRFIPANHFTQTNPSAAGIAMGALTVINAAVYLAESALSYTLYRSMD